MMGGGSEYYNQYGSDQFSSGMPFNYNSSYGGSQGGFDGNSANLEENKKEKNSSEPTRTQGSNVESSNKTNSG